MKTKVLSICACLLATLSVNANLPESSAYSTDNYQPMVVEGRTWWYQGEEWFAKHEYGLRIGSAVDIDGTEWHKVYVCHLHKLSLEAPIDNTYEWISYTEDSGLIAYIREENGKIYANTEDVNRHFEEHCFFYGIPFDSELLLNGEGKIYDFNFEDNKFVIGNEFTATENYSCVYECEVLAEDIVESHGYSYRRLSCDVELNSTFDRHAQVYFVQGIGLVEINENEHWGSLFFSPFPMYITGIGAPGEPLLRYVTDENNNIIFEYAGGCKLWEEVEEADNVHTAVNSVAVDANAPVEYFNLQGVRVANPENGLYIRRQGNSVSKVLVK